MTEDQLEQETLAWLADVGYTHLYGPDIAFDGPTPERANYRQVLLTFKRLLSQTRNAKQRQALLAGKVEDMINTVVRQIAFYNFDPNSPDAFPDVEHRTYLNLTRRQATALMAELAARINDADMTDYYGTRATVTVNLDNDGMEGS